MGTHEVINTPYQEQEFLVIVVNGTNRSSDTEKEREMEREGERERE